MIRTRSLSVVAAFLLGVGSAAAQQRCEGTLCDLYYNGSAPEQPGTAKPAAATPMTVPSLPGAGSYLSNLFSRGDSAGAQAAATAPQGSGQPQAVPQREGFFHMGGGGLTGQAPRGECGGTLCDLVHGHSSDEESGASVAQSVNGVPMSHYGRETASAEPIAAPAVPAAAPPAERRVVARAAPKPPPACALKGGDPWACYRR